MATDNISPVFLAIADVMSLNETAGPYSVPPMLSTMSFETFFTYEAISSLGTTTFSCEEYSSIDKPFIFVVDHKGVAASPCSPPTHPVI